MKRQEFTWYLALNHQNFDPSANSISFQSVDVVIPYEGRSDVRLEAVSLFALLTNPNSGPDQAAISDKVLAIIQPAAFTGLFSDANYPVFTNGNRFITLDDGASSAGIVPAWSSFKGGYNNPRVMVDSPKLSFDVSMGSKDIMNLYGDPVGLTSIDVQYRFTMLLSYLPI